MIRRRCGGENWLIRQVEHARLSAALAAQVGNPMFATPLPRQAVLTAVELHDSGWTYRDESPLLNAAGQPLDVLEMPLEAVLPLWGKSTRLAMEADPYAGLLVSLHGMALSLRAVIHTPAQQFAVIKFQHNEIELQEELRAELGLAIDRPLRHGLADPGRSAEEDLLLANFRLLEFADQLSLNLCYDEARLPRIDIVFPRPGQAGVNIVMEREAGGWFTVNPWPFAGDRLELEVSAQNIAAAAEEMLAVELRRSGALPA